LVASARDEVAARGVRRILLVTADAHEVYARLGFTAPARPDQMMELDLRVVATDVDDTATGT
jgi:hypothetical protein